MATKTSSRRSDGRPSCTLSVTCAGQRRSCTGRRACGTRLRRAAGFRPAPSRRPPHVGAAGSINCRFDRAILNPAHITPSLLVCQERECAWANFGSSVLGRRRPSQKPVCDHCFGGRRFLRRAEPAGQQPRPERIPSIWKASLSPSRSCSSARAAHACARLRNPRRASSCGGKGKPCARLLTPLRCRRHARDSSSPRSRVY